MDALTLLLTRRSMSHLTTPAPEGPSLDNILAAGMRAPDHGVLRPWHFVVIQNQGLDKFGQLLEKAAINANLGKEVEEKAKKAPLRAPLIITVIAKIVVDSKIPAWEQVVTAGCCVHAMQMAAVAQGFGGIWRTGSWTTDPVVRSGLACQERDKIVGFLYLGTPKFNLPMKGTSQDMKDFVTDY
ncbi:MAG: NAD(P)H nitroreductase [Candidatus Phlomobacter fragariae]